MYFSCRSCVGTGNVVPRCKVNTVVQVAIERGMKDGDVIRLSGMADEQPEQVEAGDVLVVVKERKHVVFTRKNDDLLITRDVTVQEALCGFDVVVKHLDGRTIVVKNRPGDFVKPSAGAQVQFASHGMAPCHLSRFADCSFSRAIPS